MGGASDVRLTGTDAVAWLRERGWVVRNASDSFRLFADAVWADDFSLARIWHTPAEVVRLDALGPTPDARTLRSLITVISGEQTLRNQGGDHPMMPNTFVLHDTSTPVTLVAERPVARMEFATPEARFAHAAPEMLSDSTSSMARGVPAVGDMGLTKLFTSSVNISLDSPIAETAPAFTAWRRSIESIAEALIRSAPPL